MTSSASGVYCGLLKTTNHEVLFVLKVKSSNMANKICLHVARLLRTHLCLLLLGAGIWNQSCFKGMELALMFPFPRLTQCPSS